ncbi:MAG: Glycosyltransferase, RfaG family [Candidatus Methanohalarchaeum thermophilum]|uniref:Glycosyltransferase, RfaG family n=1 Tax=Methanohalarchaeum thermophilum TaxID=1903181 RepID=A0A1Q6DXM0_METT1|nr:MAG: Glycosyltransferase, RfaG family [Candidatus Methanohalarchaeum thermophilum]
MKIGMFTDSYFPQINGVTYTISLWKRKLLERGHEVKVVFPSSENYEEGENEFGVKSVSFPFYDGYRIGLPQKISDKIGELDLIHTHSPFSVSFLGAYISRKRNIPRVSTHHTFPEDYIDYLVSKKMLKKSLIYLYRRWEKRFFNSAEVVTVPSKVIKEEMNKKGVRKIEVLENGVNRDFFKPSNPVFKEKFGNKLIGYSGRHSKEKNLSDIINVAKRFPEYTFLLGGNGPYRSNYKKMASDLENVKLLGFLDREKLPSFYSSIDVFVFPSIAETQGLVALEANACGTPVVGADKKALTETIVDGVNGYKYEPGDIDELEEKIEKVLESKGELSQKSKDYIKNHSVKSSIKKLINIYERITEGV